MKAYKENDSIRIEGGYLFRESIKQIEGRWYEAETKAWYVPLVSENIALLNMLGCVLDEGLSIEARGTVEEFESSPCVVMPIKATPYKHQVAAFNFALKLFGGADG